MLYVTTRVSGDAFTVHRVLTQPTGPEGGYFVPMTRPEFDYSSMGPLTFGQRVAAVLNGLFNTRLDGWDMEFAIGRYPVKLVPLGNRITLAETWHNPDWKFDRMVKSLERLLLNRTDLSEPAGEWLKIAVRIALLFGIVPDLNVESVDISVHEGDFSDVVAAWYARQWGLPVSNIVICCGEDSGIWSFLRQGEARGKVPPAMERLVYSTLGRDAALDFARNPEGFRMKDSDKQTLARGILVQVVSRKRAGDMLRSVYKTARHILEPDAAMAYGGLMDYRSGISERRDCLILSETAPVFQMEPIARSLGISKQELSRLLDRG